MFKIFAERGFVAKARCRWRGLEQLVSDVSSCRLLAVSRVLLFDGRLPWPEDCSIHVGGRGERDCCSSRDDIPHANLLLS